MVASQKFKDKNELLGQAKLVEIYGRKLRVNFLDLGGGVIKLVVCVDRHELFLTLVKFAHGVGVRP